MSHAVAAPPHHGDGADFAPHPAAAVLTRRPSRPVAAPTREFLFDAAIPAAAAPTPSPRTTGDRAVKRRSGPRAHPAGPAHQQVASLMAVAAAASADAAAAAAASSTVPPAQATRPWSSASVRSTAAHGDGEAMAIAAAATDAATASPAAPTDATSSTTADIPASSPRGHAIKTRELVAPLAAGPDAASALSPVMSPALRERAFGTARGVKTAFQVQKTRAALQRSKGHSQSVDGDSDPLLVVSIRTERSPSPSATASDSDTAPHPPQALSVPKPARTALAHSSMKHARAASKHAEAARLAAVDALAANDSSNVAAAAHTVISPSAAFALASAPPGVHSAASSALTSGDGSTSSRSLRTAHVAQVASSSADMHALAHQPLAGVAFMTVAAPPLAASRGDMNASHSTAHLAATVPMLPPPKPVATKLPQTTAAAAAARAAALRKAQLQASRASSRSDWSLEERDLASALSHRPASRGSAAPAAAGTFDAGLAQLLAPSSGVVVKTASVAPSSSRRSVFQLEEDLLRGGLAYLQPDAHAQPAAPALLQQEQNLALSSTQAPASATQQAVATAAPVPEHDPDTQEVLSRHQSPTPPPPPAGQLTPAEQAHLNATWHSRSGMVRAADGALHPTPSTAGASGATGAGVSGAGDLSPQESSSPRKVLVSVPSILGSRAMLLHGGADSTMALARSGSSRTALPLAATAAAGNHVHGANTWAPKRYAALDPEDAAAAVQSSHAKKTHRKQLSSKDEHKEPAAAVAASFGAVGTPAASGADAASLSALIRSYVPHALGSGAHVPSSHPSGSSVTHPRQRVHSPLIGEAHLHGMDLAGFEAAVGASRDQDLFLRGSPRPNGNMDATSVRRGGKTAGLVYSVTGPLAQFRKRDVTAPSSEAAAAATEGGAPIARASAAAAAIAAVTATASASSRPLLHPSVITRTGAPAHHRAPSHPHQRGDSGDNSDSKDPSAHGQGSAVQVPAPAPAAAPAPALSGSNAVPRDETVQAATSSPAPVSAVVVSRSAPRGEGTKSTEQKSLSRSMDLEGRIDLWQRELGLEPLTLAASASASASGTVTGGATAAPMGIALRPLPSLSSHGLHASPLMHTPSHHDSDPRFRIDLDLSGDGPGEAGPAWLFMTADEKLDFMYRRAGTTLAAEKARAAREPRPGNERDGAGDARDEVAREAVLGEAGFAGFDSLAQFLAMRSALDAGFVPEPPPRPVAHRSAVNAYSAAEETGALPTAVQIAAAERLATSKQLLGVAERQPTDAELNTIRLQSRQQRLRSAAHGCPSRLDPDANRMGAVPSIVLTPTHDQSRLHRTDVALVRTRTRGSAADVAHLDAVRTGLVARAEEALGRFNGGVAALLRRQEQATERMAHGLTDDPREAEGEEEDDLHRALERTSAYPSGSQSARATSLPPAAHTPALASSRAGLTLAVQPDAWARDPRPRLMPSGVPGGKRMAHGTDHVRMPVPPPHASPAEVAAFMAEAAATNGHGPISSRKHHHALHSGVGVSATAHVSSDQAEQAAAHQLHLNRLLHAMQLRPSASPSSDALSAQASQAQPQQQPQQVFHELQVCAPPSRKFVRGRPQQITSWHEKLQLSNAGSAPAATVSARTHKSRSQALSTPSSSSLAGPSALGAAGSVPFSQGQSSQDAYLSQLGRHRLVTELGRLDSEFLRQIESRHREHLDERLAMDLQVKLLEEAELQHKIKLEQKEQAQMQALAQRRVFSMAT